MFVDDEGQCSTLANRGDAPHVAVRVPDPDWQDSLLLLLRAAGLSCSPFDAAADLLVPPFATAARRVVVTGSARGRAHQVAAPVANLRAGGVTAPVLLLVAGPVEPPLACRLMSFGEAEALENLSATPVMLSTLRALARRDAPPAEVQLSPLARRAIGMMLAGRSRRTIAATLALRLGDLDLLVASASATLPVPGMVGLLRAGRAAGLLPT